MTWDGFNFDRHVPASIDAQLDSMTKQRVGYASSLMTSRSNLSRSRPQQASRSGSDLRSMAMTCCKASNAVVASGESLDDVAQRIETEWRLLSRIDSRSHVVWSQFRPGHFRLLRFAVLKK